MNRNIIIVLIVIVLIILGGLVAFSLNTAKADTQITFSSNTSLKNGDSVDFVLTDAQGNAIANQNVTILFEGNGDVERYSVITDDQGRGSLVLNDEDSGNYTITVSFAENEKYNGCSATQKITLGEESQTTSDYSASSYDSSSYSTGASSSSSSSGSELTYDSELNVNYDSNGRVVGGQNDGASYEDIKNNHPQIGEDGGLE
ncbi:MAG: carboxypeptidase regulatory-like domain-containing protein [Methanobrevibacter sp.]|nr:carboxypeptidase-like regulatory domain-containing protein [Methanobrevibacter sp.]MBE6489343.1 carboxypeptidase regulatory-like domain-containing protein [Methanobrevibacter sp.]